MVKIKWEEQDFSCCLLSFLSFQIWADSSPEQKAASSPFPAPSQVSVYIIKCANQQKPPAAATLPQKKLLSINQIKPLSASKTNQPSKITYFLIIISLNCSVPATLGRYMSGRAAPAELCPSCTGMFLPGGSLSGLMAVDLHLLFHISNRRSLSQSRDFKPRSWCRTLPTAALPIPLRIRLYLDIDPSHLCSFPAHKISAVLAEPESKAMICSLIWAPGAVAPP